MPRLLNDTLARILHEPLHKRLVAFCEQYTPEIPAEVVVNAWLQRLYNGDPTMHIHVTLDDTFTIVGHIVVDIQLVFNRHVVYCHQAQADTPNLAFLDEGIEYVEKLAQQYSATCIVFVVAKHSKVFERRYGYHAARTLMMKYINNGTSHDNT